MTMLKIIEDEVPDLVEFFSFARDAEIAIVKSGHSAPTLDEISGYSARYWRAVDGLQDRLCMLGVDDPTSDPVFRRFLDLTLRCEAAWRSRCKPRGYAGDFRAMELFYELEDSFKHGSPLSESKAPGERLIEGAFSNTHGIRLIRKRARLLESLLLNQISRTERKLEILDVGGGGARYFRRAAAKLGGKPVSYTIFDQDPSLPSFWRNEVSEDIARNVNVVSAPIKQFFNGGHPAVASEAFDLILSSGLFDYLNQGVAKELAGRLFSMLRPGGSLVIANMLDSEPSQAAFFRETLMDWKIVTRSDEQMHALVPSITASDYQRMPEADLGIIHFTRQGRASALCGCLSLLKW